MINPPLQMMDERGVVHLATQWGWRTFEVAGLDGLTTLLNDLEAKGWEIHSVQMLGHVSSVLGPAGQREASAKTVAWAVLARTPQYKPLGMIDQTTGRVMPGVFPKEDGGGEEPGGGGEPPPGGLLQ